MPRLVEGRAIGWVERLEHLSHDTRNTNFSGFLFSSYFFFGNLVFIRQPAAVCADWFNCVFSLCVFGCCCCCCTSFSIYVFSAVWGFLSQIAFCSSSLFVCTLILLCYFSLFFFVFFMLSTRLRSYLRKGFLFYIISPERYVLISYFLFFQSICFIFCILLCLIEHNGLIIVFHSFFTLIMFSIISFFGSFFSLGLMEYFLIVIFFVFSLSLSLSLSVSLSHTHTL